MNKILNRIRKGRLLCKSLLNLPSELFIDDTDIRIPAHNWVIGAVISVESTILEKRTSSSVSMIYEPYELPFFKKMIFDASIVFDVGSNFGWYSLIARNAKKEVHSFEIIDEYFEFLQLANIKNNLSITCNHCAVGDYNSRPTYSDIMVEGSAPTLILDEYCEKHKVWPDAIKMDIEGWELEALKGATEVLSRKPKLQISIHDAFLKKKGSSEEKILEFLSKFGYETKKKFYDCFWLA